MLDVLFTRLGAVVAVAFISVIVWLVRVAVIAWRDTNGNGVIDEDE